MSLARQDTLDRKAKQLARFTEVEAKHAFPMWYGILAEAGQLPEFAAAPAPLPAGLAALRELVRRIETQDFGGYTQRDADAVAERLHLAGYRQVVEAQSIWDDSWPPGGYVCAACSTPTESEPCQDHQPIAWAAMT